MRCIVGKVNGAGVFSHSCMMSIDRKGENVEEDEEEEDEKEQTLYSLVPSCTPLFSTNLPFLVA